MGGRVLWFHGFTMLESAIEAKLTQAVKNRNGLCWKFTSPGTDGVPDRIVILPGRPAAFVEVKAPGKKPRPQQTRRISQLQNVGTQVFVVDHADRIEGVLNAIQTA